jgi:hypothetical protein
MTKMYQNIILPLVLYGCGTWDFTLMEECRLRVLMNSEYKERDI